MKVRVLFAAAADGGRDCPLAVVVTPSDEYAELLAYSFNRSSSRQGRRRSRAPGQRSAGHRR
jgi:hypothetical protein